MGKSVFETDFNAREIYNQRVDGAARRHDQMMYQKADIKNVPFDSNFDVFAASVAYALREMMTYRTDGGLTARGLVRASGDLELLHRAYMESKARPENGSPIRLRALFFRRKHLDPTRRWMMWIRFGAPDWEFGDNQDDGFDITPDASVEAKGWKNVTESLVSNGNLWAGTQKGDRAQRVQDMLKIAERLGYPKNWDMWYYAQPAVYEYMRWESAQPNEENMGSRSKRGKMTLQTQGKFPFDGDNGLLHIPWRIFLFREAAKEAAAKGPDSHAAVISQKLKSAEEQIQMTFEAIEKEIGRVSSVPTSLNPFSLTGKSAESLGPLAFSFLQHLWAMTKDQNTMYSVYRPAKGSFWFDIGWGKHFSTSAG